jgi:hypothetical protein
MLRSWADGGAAQISNASCAQHTELVSDDCGARGSSITAPAVSRPESHVEPQRADAETTFTLPLLNQCTAWCEGATATEGAIMMGDNKVQGEGDYESAKRFDKDEQEFVKEHTKGGKEIRGNAEDASDELTPAERAGRSHAKDGEEDRRDAELMDKLEKRDKRD